MQGPSHLILGWCIGEAFGLSTPRLRRVVALAGLASDIDVLAYVGGIFYFRFDIDQAFAHAHHVFHHHYTHGIGFIALAMLAAVAYILLRGAGKADVSIKPQESRGAAAARVALISGLAVLVHIFCDLIGSGYNWPIYPYWPLSESTWAVRWSWEIGEWPNLLIMWSLLAVSLLYARKAGHSFLESVHYGLDRWIVRILQNGSDKPGGAAGGKKTEAVAAAGTPTR